MSEIREDVYVIIDQHGGKMLGSHVFTSEAHAIKWIQEKGFSYDPHLNPIMPATITYRSDRGSDS